MNLAVIPARGGSKRISSKNIRPFLGKPIIAYSIEAALDCGLFEQVVVSTDDEQVAEVARAHGGETPFVRPPELSDDHTGTNAVARHAIDWFRAQGHSVEHACCLYATAPFVDADALRRGYETFIESGAAFAFTVTSYPFPVQRALRLTEEGRIAPLCPESIMKRSQDLEEAYHDAGQFYWGRADAFVDDLTALLPQAAPIFVPRHRTQDIDTPEDWTRAELMVEAWLGRQR